MDRMDRELSGIFVRVQVDGKWGNKDITDCDDAQITKILGGRDQEELIRWLVRIAKQFNTMLKASDLDLEEIPDELVAECITKWSEQDILEVIILLCKVYRKTGDVFDIRKAP
jgi:hypothetical protein